MDKKPLTPAEAHSLRSHYQTKIDNIFSYLETGKYPELKRLLNERWRERVQTWLSSIQPGQVAPPRQLHHLISALADGDNRPFHIGVDVFEKRLQVVREAATSQGKTKQYKSTPNQLVVDNANQVHASIFEIAILTALIGIDPDLVLYPDIGSGSKDVEAKISLDGREIFCECAVRGYSPRLDNRQGAIDPYAAPRKMVEATLLKKMGHGGQLAHVADEYPTILFTCVGFDIFHHTYVDEMKHRITETSCSASVIFERYHCNSFALVLNDASPHPLQSVEIQTIEAGFRQHLGSTFLGIHHAGQYAI